MIRRHSGFGIASFVAGLVAGTAMLAVFVTAGMIEASTPGGIDETSMTAAVIGLFMIAFVLLSMIGLGLGIGGLVQRERDRTFAVLGTVFSAATLTSTIAVIALGFASA